MSNAKSLSLHPSFNPHTTISLKQNLNSTFGKPKYTYQPITTQPGTPSMNMALTQGLPTNPPHSPRLLSTTPTPLPPNLTPTSLLSPRRRQLANPDPRKNPALNGNPGLLTTASASSFANTFKLTSPSPPTPNPTKIPTAYHTVSRTPIPPFSGQILDEGTWVRTSFPSLTPEERREVVLLSGVFTKLIAARDHTYELEASNVAAGELAIVRVSNTLGDIVKCACGESKTYSLVMSEVIRQEMLHCKERGGVLTMVMEQYEGMVGRIKDMAGEAKILVEQQTEDRVNLHEQIIALQRVLNTLKESYWTEINNYKSLVTDQHKLEIAKVEMRVTIEQELIKAKERGAVTIQRLVRGRRGRGVVFGRKKVVSAIRVQTLIRGLMALRTCAIKRETRRKLTVAANFVQRCWRGAVIRLTKIKVSTARRARPGDWSSNVTIAAFPPLYLSTHVLFSFLHTCVCVYGCIAHMCMSQIRRDLLKRQGAAIRVTETLRAFRDLRRYLRMINKIKDEKSKPYWVLVNKLNEVTERLKVMEEMMLFEEPEDKSDSEDDNFFDVDPFDTRDGKERFPVVKERVQDLEKLVTFKKSIFESKRRAKEFASLADDGGVMLRIVRGNELNRRAAEEMDAALASGQHHRHHGLHHGYHGQHHDHHHKRRATKNSHGRSRSYRKGESSASLLSVDSQASLSGADNNVVPEHESAGVKARAQLGKMSSMPTPHDLSNEHEAPLSYSRQSSVGDDGRARSYGRQSSVGHSARPAVHRQSSVGPPARQASSSFDSEASLTPPPSHPRKQSRGRKRSVELTPVARQPQNEPLLAAARSAHESGNEDACTRSISPMNDFSQLTDSAITSMKMGAWEAPSPQPRGEDFDFSLVAENELGDMLARAATAEMKKESKIRIDAIVASIDEAFVSSRPSLSKLNEQLNVMGRLEEFINSDVVGTWDPAKMERRKKKKTSKKKRKGRDSHGHAHSGEDSSSSEEEEEATHWGEFSSSKKEKFHFTDQGEIELDGSKAMQPLLRQVVDVFDVSVRKAKSSNATVKDILNLYRTVQDILHRDGQLDLGCFGTLKLAGYDLSLNKTMVRSSELRDYAFSRTNSPNSGTKCSPYWRMAEADGPGGIRRGILATRGSSKATDQQIVDLIVSCKEHRHTDKGIGLFCSLMEVEEDGSTFPFVIFSRHTLSDTGGETKFDKQNIPCVTYEEVVCLASKLYQYDIAECRQAARRAIQMSKSKMALSQDVTTEHVKTKHQVEHFFERIWGLVCGKEAAGEGGGEEKKEDESEEVSSNGNVLSPPSSPKAPRSSVVKKSMQLMEGGRRQSILEIGGFDPAAEAAAAAGGGENWEGEDDGECASEDNATVSSGSSDDDDEVYSKIDVEEELWDSLCATGSVLEIATSAHSAHCTRQHLSVWSTVAFINSDKYNKGNLTLMQFKNAMEGCNPEKDENELQSMYSDVVYASDNQLMTFKTFKQAMFRLFVDGDLVVPHVSEEDINETAGLLERGGYVEKGE